MRKIKHQILSILAACILFYSMGITGYAYNYEDYDRIEDDGTILVDKKEHPNVTCQVSLTILYPQKLFQEGIFSWLFTAENVDVPEGYSFGPNNLSEFCYQNRWENAKRLDKNIGTGTLLHYTFFIEPGTYNFSTNSYLNFAVLTPDLEYTGRVEGATEEEFEANKVRYPVTVTESTHSIKLYAIFATNTQFVEENVQEFAEYAKEISGNNNDEQLDDVTIESNSSLGDKEDTDSNTDYVIDSVVYEENTNENYTKETDKKSLPIVPLIGIVALVGVTIFIKKKL